MSYEFIGKVKNLKIDNNSYSCSFISNDFVDKNGKKYIIAIDDSNDVVDNDLIDINEYFSLNKELFEFISNHVNCAFEISYEDTNINIVENKSIIDKLKEMDVILDKNTTDNIKLNEKLDEIINSLDNILNNVNEFKEKIEAIKKNNESDISKTKNALKDLINQRNKKEINSKYIVTSLKLIN